MRKYVLIALMLLVAAAAIAQENKSVPPPRNDFGWARNPYRLDYAIKELEDGKVVNTRNYSMVMQSAEDRGRSFGETKTGSRVPITTTESKTGEKQIQYIDVGVNISSQLYQMESGTLLLMAGVEISSIATAERDLTQYSSSAPIIRQVRSSTTSEITAGKPNQIALVDDAISKRRFQIEVTATKLR